MKLEREGFDGSVSGLLFFRKRPFPRVVEHEMVEIAKQAPGTEGGESSARDFTHEIKFLIIFQTEITTAFFRSNNFEFTGFHRQRLSSG